VLELLRLDYSSIYMYIFYFLHFLYHDTNNVFKIAFILWNDNRSERCCYYRTKSSYF